MRRIAAPLAIASAEALAMLTVSALVRRTRKVDVPLDLLIGYPLFGTLCFLVATLHVSLLSMVPLLIVGASAGAALLVIRRRQTRDDPAQPHIEQSPALLAIAVIFACAFLSAQAPPTTLDELAYHLAVPHTWVIEGRAVELPLLSHSYFPLGVEAADLPALTLLGATDGGLASHFLHLFAALATTALIARRSRSWLATAAIVTTPALAVTTGWSLVDWPLVGLVVALYVSLEESDVATASAATAAGLLTKYTFGPFVLLAWAIKRRLPRATALLGLVFLARNLLLTGNPFAPFFAADSPHVAGYRNLALADYIFEGRFVDEALGASLVTMPLLATGAIAVASALLAAGLFFLAPSSRILIPFLVPPAIAAAPQLRRKPLAVAMTVAIVIQCCIVVWFTTRSGAFALLAGSVNEQEYVRKARPAYASVELLNGILPAQSRTLVIGLGETYWYERSVRGGGNFDGPRVARYLETPAPEALRARLRRDGITHIAVVTPRLASSVEQKRQERQTTLSPAARRMLAQTLDRYAASVASHGDVTLFALR